MYSPNSMPPRLRCGPSPAYVGGAIRVAAFNSVATGLVVPALMVFRQRYKGVRMTFTEAEPEISMPAVANGDLDLAITHEYGRLPKPDLSGLRQVLLHRDQLLLAVPPHLQRAGQKTARLRDYAEATWLSALPSSGFQAATELLCRAEGFEPDIAFGSDQYELLLQMVAADFGVTLVPSLAATPRRGVDYLEVSQPTRLTHDIHITTRDADTSPAVEALTALLVQRGRLILAEGDQRNQFPSRVRCDEAGDVGVVVGGGDLHDVAPDDVQP
ncbi:DNA-binding transcriptional LysR family regulator [Catenulispora sp. GP43]